MTIDKRCPVGPLKWQALIEFLGAGDGATAFLGARNRYHCEYVVYTDGTYYYAENGETGELDYGGSTSEGGATGTDSAAVVQAAHDALTGGGTIVIKGIHTFDSSVTITNPVRIIGTKMGVPGIVGARTTISRSTDNPIFVINEDYVSFEDLLLWGDATHTSALVSVIGSPKSPIFRRIWLQRNGGRGIDIGSGYWALFEKIRATNLADYAIYSSDGPGIVIRGLSSLSCAGLVYIAGGRGHIIEDIEADTFIEGNSLIYVSVANVGIRALNLEGDPVVPFQTRAIELVNARFSMDNVRLTYLGGNAPNLNPIYIQTSSYGRISSLMTENTYSTNSVEFGVNVFIEFDQPANDLDVLANGLYDNEGTAVMANGTNAIAVAHGLMAAPTEGTAVMANGTNAIAVAHGLMAAPTNIRVTGGAIDVTDLYADTVGAVNFTIRKTAGVTGGNRDIYWQADMR